MVPVTRRIRMKVDERTKMSKAGYKKEESQYVLWDRKYIE